MLTFEPSHPKPIQNHLIVFFKGNEEFVENIEKIEDELKSKWERLNIDQGRI